MRHRIIRYITVKHERIYYFLWKHSKQFRKLVGKTVDEIIKKNGI